MPLSAVDWHKKTGAWRRRFERENWIRVLFGDGDRNGQLFDAGAFDEKAASAGTAALDRDSNHVATARNDHLGHDYAFGNVGGHVDQQAACSGVDGRGEGERSLFALLQVDHAGRDEE